jgi:hypothetical protein
MIKIAGRFKVTPYVVISQSGAEIIVYFSVPNQYIVEERKCSSGLRIVEGKPG